MAGLSRSFYVILAVTLAAIILTAGEAAAVTYTMNVTTDQPTYVGSQSVKISGSVSPGPGPSTAVTLKVVNPSKTVLGVWEAAVGATSGLFNYTIVAGGSSGWIMGTYFVNATWGAYSPQLYAHTTFTWSPSVTTTTTTTTTSTTPTTITTTTTTTPTTTTTTTPTTTTTSSSGGGGIPEFPFQAVSVGILTALIAAGYLLARRSSWGPRRPLAS